MDSCLAYKQHGYLITSYSVIVVCLFVKIAHYYRNLCYTLYGCSCHQCACHTSILRHSLVTQREKKSNNTYQQLMNRSVRLRQTWTWQRSFEPSLIMAIKLHLCDCRPTTIAVNVILMKVVPGAHEGKEPRTQHGLCIPTFSSSTVYPRIEASLK